MTSILKIRINSKDKNKYNLGIYCRMESENILITTKKKKKIFQELENKKQKYLEITLRNNSSRYQFADSRNFSESFLNVTRFIVLAYF